MDLKGNPYTKASVLKIIQLLEKVHRIKVNRRWVFKCLADMIKAGLLTRRARFKHERDGTVRQLSSIVAFSLKGAKFLLDKRVSGAKLLMDKILRWIKGQDKRWPTRADYLKSREKEMDEQERRINDNPVFNVHGLLKNIG
jgi:hypothetical protein